MDSLYTLMYLSDKTHGVLVCGFFPITLIITVSVRQFGFYAIPILI